MTTLNVTTIGSAVRYAAQAHATQTRPGAPTPHAHPSWLGSSYG